MHLSFCQMKLLAEGAWGSGVAKTILADVRTLEPANPSILDAATDLTNLSYLNEPSILHGLRLRYEKDEIYTQAGPVLIAINPFKKVSAPGSCQTPPPPTLESPIFLWMSLRM